MCWPASAVALLLISACGAGSDERAAAGPPPATELRIEFSPRGERGETRTATLTCDPAGGTHPRAAAACAALTGHPEALERVPRNAVCTQIYGGPEKAVVTGTFESRSILARFDRTNGCQISRWDALEPLLRLRD